MSEGKIIAETREPNTVDTICRDLAALGVSRGDVVLVHSSLSSLGWVCGGPQTVIMALMKSVGASGTLVMPAHSGEWSDPAEWRNPPVPESWIPVIYKEMPAFDPDVTPTRGMGSIPELFRTYPGTLRSNHPQVSFCANGKASREITVNHPLTPQLGMDSPLGKMYNLRAKVLLLGVGYNSCTSFHLAETFFDEMPIKRMGTAMSKQGERVWKWFEDYDYDPDDFTSIGEEFEETPTVQKGKIGNAECRIFDLKAGVT